MLVVGNHGGQLPNGLRSLRSHIGLVCPLRISAALGQATCQQISMFFVFPGPLLLKFIHYLFLCLPHVFRFAEHDRFELAKLQVILVDALAVNHDALIVLCYITHLKHIFGVVL